jgi:hypothetical protein
MTFTDDMTSQQRWELELQGKRDIYGCSRCTKKAPPFGMKTCEACRAAVDANRVKREAQR